MRFRQENFLVEDPFNINPSNYQVLSATIEWSVILMLKEFLFVVMFISFTVTYTFERPGCLHQKYDEDVGEGKENEERHRLGAEEKEQSTLRETCSACGPALCSLGFCFFAPFTSTCCKFARGENPYSFTFYLANGFNFFWRGFQLRFLRAFGDFSSGLVSLLSAPVEDEDSRFFALKSSLRPSSSLAWWERSLARSSSPLSFQNPSALWLLWELSSSTSSTSQISFRGERSCSSVHQAPPGLP